MPIFKTRLFLSTAAAAIALTAANVCAEIAPFLPFEMPSTSALRESPKKVFAHYFTPFRISIDNREPSEDYYTTHFLNPHGEFDKHLEGGGYLRQRPLPRPVRTGNNGASLDLQLEVRRAIDIGLDGFTVDLLSTKGKLFEQTKLLLDSAHTIDPGFKIALMPDMMAIKSDDQNVLADAIEALAAYPACYRMEDGRLLVAPYNAHQKSVDWWKNWLANMEKRGIKIAFLPLFQGWRRYLEYAPISEGFSDWGDRSAYINLESPSWLNAATDAHKDVRIWMHPIAPQDQRPKNLFFREARNTQLFRAGWEFGAIGKADWVQLITWNDYSESSEISPSTGTQHLFYDLSAYYIAWFKTGTSPPVTRDCIYYSHRQHSITAQPDLTLQKKPFDIPNGGGKASDNIEALVFLTADATLEIEIGGEMRSFSVKAPRDVVTIPVQEGTPRFRLFRDSTEIASVRSAFPINNHITYQNPMYYGGSSLRPPVTQVPGVRWPQFTFPAGDK